MPNNEIDYEAVRRRAEKRTNEKIEFYIHISVYIIVNLVLWALGLALGSVLGLGTWGIFIPLLVTLGWGIGAAIHGAKVYLEGGLKDRMRDQAIRREMELERLRLGINEENEDSDEELVLQKPKRRNKDRVVRLGDDGELVDAESDEEQATNRDHAQHR